MSAYDPRGIANLMLDQAEARGIRISNLALQKLLYFAHGIYLTQNKRPLVSGYFEAWKHWPVHPAVYRAFKGAGADAITRRAVARDPLTGAERDLPPPNDQEVQELITDVIRKYGKLSPGRLGSGPIDLLAACWLA